MAAGLVDADVLIYMTQDAIPATADSLQRLRDAVLSDERIGVAYGRQLAHPGASLLAAHARAFNYPDSSRTKRREDAGELGIKTCFSSDAFCAYRRSALQAVGGFPVDVIGTEDAYVAGRMLLEGWDVRYEAGSQVFHSHDYTMPQEFSRYFDIGVFYGREQWINRQFGGAGKEGGRFIHSEIDAAYAAGKFWLIPEILLRSTLKWCGYRLGRAEAWLPRSFKRQVSMFSAYWN
jgi:rhamnosyltransferase